jgi:hypothetical protein
MYTVLKLANQMHNYKLWYWFKNIDLLKYYSYNSNEMWHKNNFIFLISLMSYVIRTFGIIWSKYIFDFNNSNFRTRFDNFKTVMYCWSLIQILDFYLRFGGQMRSDDVTISLIAPDDSEQNTLRYDHTIITHKILM